MSKQNSETMKDRNKNLDMNEVEMIFGRPNGRSDRPDVHLIANEKRNGREPQINHHQQGSDSDVEIVPTQPLLERDVGKQKPPLAGPEIDDLDDVDARPSVAAPYPGIDDGLLDVDDHPKKPEGHDVHGEGDHKGSDGDIETRDDGVGTDDGKSWPHGVDEADFPYDGINGFGPRFGIDDRPISPVPGSIPDVNTYQQKKNLAQGMMDLALLSANANQLRYVMESSQTHPYYYPSLVFISLSIVLQIAVGVGLIMNSRYNVKDEKDICKADKINNMTVLGVFLVTIVNVFITSFSVATVTPITATTAVQNAG